MIQHSANTISSKDISAVKTLLASGMLASGKNCEEFKEKLGNYFACENVYLTNTGSSAIYFALKALNTKKTEIVFPTYVCKDVIEVVFMAGFKPVLCDIGEQWNVSCASIKNKITKSTAAIIVPHNLGICVNVKELKAFNVPIIEDCCQSIGAYYNNALSGTMGDITVLSFNATKCLTTGEGGAVLINTKKKIKNNKSLQSLGHILRMSDLQAVLGIQQLSEYDSFLKKRKELAQFYFKNINKKLTEKFNDTRQHSMFFRFLLYSNTNFLEVQTYLNQKNIAVRKGIDALLHRQYKIGKDTDFKNAVNHFNKTISIPIYPSLKIEQAKYISTTVNNYFNEA